MACGRWDMQIPCFLYKNHSESYKIMHNILQKLVEIFKTVGADELHNTKIYNKWKPMNEIDRVRKTRNCRASNPDKDRKSSSWPKSSQ